MAITVQECQRQIKDKFPQIKSCKFHIVSLNYKVMAQVEVEDILSDISETHIEFLKFI